MLLADVLPYASMLLAIATFFIGRLSTSKSEGERDGTILTEIGSIKSGIEDIKRQQEAQNEKHIEVMTRLSAVEASAKQAHHRIDEIREHCCDK